MGGAFGRPLRGLNGSRWNVEPIQGLLRCALNCYWPGYVQAAKVLRNGEAAIQDYRSSAFRLSMANEARSQL